MSDWCTHGVRLSRCRRCQPEHYARIRAETLEACAKWLENDAAGAIAPFSDCVTLARWLRSALQQPQQGVAIHTEIRDVGEELRAVNVRAPQRSEREPEPPPQIIDMMEALKNALKPGAKVKLMEPIPILLTCPSCGTRHIDEGEFATKVHHTHACQSCGMCWRPAVVPTVGVRFLPGFKNTTEAKP